jgi:hypothetical protein
MTGGMKKASGRIKEMTLFLPLIPAFNGTSRKGKKENRRSKT